jgi:hypothetical protein
MIRRFVCIILATLAMYAAVNAFGQTQTPAYTQSVSYACNQETCNGLPLDQGGTWQFILANGAFSLNCNGFFIFGNPGNPGSGGITNVQDNIPEPPLYKNLASGGEGQLAFSFAAVNSDGSMHYVGHVVANGHEVRHCYLHGCWDQTIVDFAQIFIDSAN